MPSLAKVNISTPATCARRRVVVASVPSPKQTSRGMAPKPHWAFPTLLAGFAAAQVSLISGPAVADAYTPLPSIDWVSESNAADVLVEVQDAKIPQLEARLGALANQPNAAESVAAAERELQAIESEAAVIAEQEERDGSTPAIAQEVGGLLSNLTALKGAMRGMMGSN